MDYLYVFISMYIRTYTIYSNPWPYLFFNLLIHQLNEQKSVCLSITIIDSKAQYLHVSSFLFIHGHTTILPPFIRVYLITHTYNAIICVLANNYEFALYV